MCDQRRRRADLPARPSDPRRERIDGVPFADCPLGSRVTILRLENEAEDLLHYLRASGIFPGLTGEISDKDAEPITVTGPGGPATVTISVAETVSVTADPSPPPPPRSRTSLCWAGPLRALVGGGGPLGRAIRGRDRRHQTA